MNMNDPDIPDESKHQLAAGVLNQAAKDLRRFHGATSKVERELYFDAYSWVISDDLSWPFSFANVCRILNRAPEEIRQELVGDLSCGPVGRFVRRCGRAVRLLASSLNQRSVSSINLAMAMPSQLVQTWH
jgi:hypothetical protein